MALRKGFLWSAIFFISLLALLSVPSRTSAENLSSLGSFYAAGETALSLKECVRMALENNLDIRVERHNPQIGEKEVIKEKAEFDPVASVRVSNQKSVTSGTSLLSGAGTIKALERLPGWEDTLELEGLDFSAGISKKLFTGGEYALELTNNRYKSNSVFQFYDTTYRSDFVLSVNQPLLKGFGRDVNRSKITVASNNQSISESYFKQKVMDIVSEVQERYWDLSFSIENLKVERESLKLAQDLLARNKALVQVGKLAPVETLQAEVGMASREEGVVVAESAVMDSQDELRRILNLVETVEENQPMIIPADKPLLAEQRICLQEVVESAIKNRPEYKQAQIDLENKKLALTVAKNRILPAFNLEGSCGLNGIDNSYHGGVDELSGGDRYSWQVGINFQFPIGNRRAKSDYLAKELEVKRTDTFLDQLKKKL